MRWPRALVCERRLADRTIGGALGEDTVVVNIDEIVRHDHVME